MLSTSASRFGASRRFAEAVCPGGQRRRQWPAVESRDLFEILTREHIDSVRAFLLSSLRDQVAAEDLVQEAFLVAWRILDRYDRQLPFGPWVRGIAGKLLLNHRRKLGRTRVHYCDDQVLGQIDNGFSDFAHLPGDTFDEQLDALRDCLGRLNGVQRESISLHYEHGLHCKEIADRLGLGFEAVKKHLQRGRAILHRCVHSKLPKGATA
jgi:RNA polymerase sigma-70 factor (ECF subfamily)